MKEVCVFALFAFILRADNIPMLLVFKQIMHSCLNLLVITFSPLL